MLFAAALVESFKKHFHSQQRSLQTLAVARGEGWEVGTAVDSAEAEEVGCGHTGFESAPHLNRMAHH